MTPEEVQARIEAAFEDCQVTVDRARGEADDGHLRATVVSPAFEDVPLVDQHQMVYDALGDAMTTEVHALEVSTRTPDS